MKFILIGNYQPDKQESMNRYADMLIHGLTVKGIYTELWHPNQIFSIGSKSTNAGINKWLAYLDKWVLFPLILKYRLFKMKASDKRDTIFHICDHSNSPYLKSLPIKNTMITCHDVLAIRGALGYSDAHCPASSTGKILQKWILNNLFRAKYLMADSTATLKQLKELRPNSIKDRWVVMYVGFNAEFVPLDFNSCKPLLLKLGLNVNLPYILNVGSNLNRKNRKLLIDMAYNLGNAWNGTICFAGQPLEQKLNKYADSLNLGNRIVSIKKPDHHTLLALYSNCEALIFPSFSEGFGWPVIEAQACGAPVIASNIEPMPEIGGGAALHADPYNSETFAAAFLKLQDDEFRMEIIAKGYKNCDRFKLEKMIDKYVDYSRQIIN